MNEEKFVSDAISIMAGVLVIDGLIDRMSRLDRWINKRCGNCSRWMKSSLCPRVKPTPSGINTGPSMNEHGCNLFEVDEMSKKFWERERAEIMADPGFKDVPEKYLKMYGFGVDEIDAPHDALEETRT